jgi:transcriptional regulator GlxA family with amidase domain
MFRTSIGDVPQRYVGQRRLERAKRMPVDGKLCLAQIAIGTPN